MLNQLIGPSSTIFISLLVHNIDIRMSYTTPLTPLFVSMLGENL